jgi:hypothetical protein
MKGMNPTDLSARVERQDQLSLGLAKKEILIRRATTCCFTWSGKPTYPPPRTRYREWGGARATLAKARRRLALGGPGEGKG